MVDHVYRLSEVVGSSRIGVDDAIKNAVRRAAEGTPDLEWFQMQEVRGQIVDGEVAYFQVALKLGGRISE
jgi:flavin-binding protein dodecin